MGAGHQGIFPLLDHQITHADLREILFETGPVHAAIQSNEQSIFRAKEKQIGIDRILPDNMSMTNNIIGGDSGPVAAHINGVINMGLHVPGAVTVKSDKSLVGIMRRCLHATHPGSLRQTINIIADLAPFPAVITADLQVAVIGSHPDDIFVERRFADAENSAVVFSSRVVDGQTTGLFLPLQIFVVGGQIRRDGFPRFSPINTPMKKLGPNIKSRGIGGTAGNGHIPMKPQLRSTAPLQRLDVLVLARAQILAVDVSALPLPINDVLIQPVNEHGKSITTTQVFPVGILDSRR